MRTILALLLLAATLPLRAQEARAPIPEATPIPSPDASPSPGDLKPTKDLIDLVRGLRHKPEPPPPGPDDYKKRMVAGSPVVGYSPTSGVSAGFAGNVAFYRGFPETTRISSIVASATATSKAQFLVSAKMNINSLENRWRIEADNRFYWTSQPTYGLGSSTSKDASVDMKFNHFRIVDTYYKQLAFWTFGDLVTGGVAPYLDLPSTGGDTYARSGRGYPQGRFRGQEMLYGEAEYRVTLSDNGLFGMVAFVNTETLSNEQENERLFDSFATGAGLGFRFMLNKQSKTNLCFDIGRGKGGSKAIYFAVQEAF